MAAFLGVHPETVAEWVRAHEAGGDMALAAKPHPGRKPFLSPGQEKTVLGWLADPPTTHGFRTDLWTARRLAELVERKLKVKFHPHYFREWLTRRDYSPQEPARRPRQRDQAAIDRWVKADWPRPKKRPAGGRPTSC